MGNYTNELAQQVENNLLEASASAQQLALIYEDELLRSQTMHGTSHESTDLDTGNYLLVDYDSPLDEPKLIRVDFIAGMHKQRNQPSWQQLVYTRDKLTLFKDTDNEDKSLFTLGEGFARGIGPKRQARTLGYTAIIRQSIEARIESPDRYKFPSTDDIEIEDKY
jgi:hypothetical protein